MWIAFFLSYSIVLSILSAVKSLISFSHLSKDYWQLVIKWWSFHKNCKQRSVKQDVRCFGVCYLLWQLHFIKSYNDLLKFSCPFTLLSQGDYLTPGCKMRSTISSRKRRHCRHLKSKSFSVRLDTYLLLCQISDARLLKYMESMGSNSL